MSISAQPQHQTPDVRLPFQAPVALDAPTAPRVVAVEGALGTALAAIAGADGALGEVLLAAWSIWLHRMGEQADLAIGLTVAAPDATLVAHEVVPVPVGGQTAAEVVRAVRQGLGARRPSEGSLTAGFAFVDDAGDGLSARAVGAGAACALSLVARREAGEVALALHYDARAFGPATVERFAEGLATLIGEVATRPEAPVASLGLVGPRERHRLLVEFQGPTLEGARPLVHRALEAIAAETPDKPLFTFQGQTLSHAEFQAKANRLARHLAAQGVGPGTIVALRLGWSVEVPIAMVAVLKTGGAYMVLDAHVPDARAAQILETLDRPVLLTREAPSAALAAPAARVIALAEAAAAIAAAPAEPLAIDVPPEAIGGIYLTSGSTGQPKPVAYSHRAIANLLVVNASIYGPYLDDEKYLYLSPFSFLTGLGMLSVMNDGAHLVIGDAAIMADPLAIFERVREDGITRIFLIPTMWRAAIDLIEALEPAARERLLDNRLTHILTGGEPLPSALVERWWSRCSPTTRVLSGYGQTETNFVAHHESLSGQLHGGIEPAGRSAPDSQVYLLDDQLAPVPLGMTGMIHGRSSYMSDGYLGQVDPDDGKKVPNPFGPGHLFKLGDLGRFDESGRLHVLGRLDHMVKIRGQRVELGEVVTRLEAHPAIRAAAVVGRPDARGALMLVAYAVARSAPPDLGELRAFLASALSSAMMPAHVVFLDALPTNANGKVDHAALRALPLEVATAPGPRVGPATETEARLLAIWQDVLNRTDVGCEDDFFELGGDSLGAARVMAAAMHVFGRRAPLSVLLRKPTIAAIASAIEAGEGDADDALVVPLRASGSQPPLVLLPPVGGGPETYLTLAQLLPADQPVYAAHQVGSLGPADFNAALPRLAEHYVAEIRRLLPDGPLRVGGHSSGGFMALEVVRQLEAWGRPVERLWVLDSLKDPAHPAPQVTTEGRWRAALIGRVRSMRLAGAQRPKAWVAALATTDWLRSRLGARATASLPVATPEGMRAPSTPESARWLPPLTRYKALEILERHLADLSPEARLEALRLVDALGAVPVEARRARLFSFLEAHGAFPTYAHAGLPAGVRRDIARGYYMLFEAVSHYTPAGPIAAPIVLMRATGTGIPAEAAIAQWQPLTTSTLTCVAAPGDHMTFMEAPHLAAGLDALRRAPEGSQGRDGTEP